MKLGFDSRPAKRGQVAVQLVTRDQIAQIVPKVPKAEFSARLNSTYWQREKLVLYVGLGDRAQLNRSRVRSACAAAVAFLKGIQQVSIAIHLEDWHEYADAAVEGIYQGDYRFQEFHPKKVALLASVRCLVLPQHLKRAQALGKRGAAVGQAVRLARENGNRPGNLYYPATLASVAQRLAKETRLSVTVLDHKKLQEGKFGGILAVGSGSARPPRLIILQHRGGPSSQAPIALVGKAITFDTGGISIKPAAQMEEMIFDKCGGMAVLGAMLGIATLNIKRNVIGIIAAAENMPSATAYRPGDIVTTYDGTHVEIVNTDAEGRMVLADAIAYARKKAKAAAIVDLATLTGACGVALGEHAAGLWSSDPALLKRLQSASEISGERLWHMPLFPEYTEQIRSAVADLKNSGGRNAGACTAAAFLQHFAGDTPWAHLDIAYTAHSSKDRPGMTRGATGFGVSTLIELINSWR